MKNSYRKGPDRVHHASLPFALCALMLGTFVAFNRIEIAVFEEEEHRWNDRSRPGQY